MGLKSLDILANVERRVHDSERATASASWRKIAPRLESWAHAT
jgi:hypothetical protein